MFRIKIYEDLPNSEQPFEYSKEWQGFLNFFEMFEEYSETKGWYNTLYDTYNSALNEFNCTLMPDDDFQFTVLEFRDEKDYVHFKLRFS